MNLPYRSAIAAALLTIAGCQPHPLETLGASRAATMPTRVDPIRADEGQGDAAPRPTGDLTLAEAAPLVLMHNPRLRAYATDVRIAEARAIQAGLWSNPEIGLELENIVGSGRLSGVDAAETTLSLAQTLPLGGDMQRRRELAGVRTQLANWDYQAERLAVLSGLTRRFVEALGADRRIGLAERELELARATQDITIGRVEAGDASPVEQSRVVVPVITAEVALQRARRQRHAAYRRIAASWGGHEVTFDRVTGDLEHLDDPPPPDTLVRLVNRNPNVARWATEISERMAVWRLAQAESVPDLTGAVGLKHHNEDDEVALVVGISLPLPLFDRRQGDMTAARLGAASAGQRRLDAQLRIESMLSVAYADLAGSYDEAVAMRARAIPAATRAYEATRQAFNEGKLPFLDVLDAQRTLFGLQQHYLDALTSYHTAVAEIESLIGQPLADIEPSPPHTETQP